MVTTLPEGVKARQNRLAPLERATLDAEKRTVELAFSSEEPVERWWGVEILGHGRDEIVSDFIGGGTAPLLVDHDPRDLVGVVEGVSLGADRKMRATVRFGRSARAAEVMQDVADGIRTNVSVGYELMEVVLEREEKGSPPVYRATRWRPFEVSLVAIPADATVGVGRGDPEAPPRRPEPATVPAAPATQEARMEPDSTHPAGGGEPAAPQPPPAASPDAAAAAEARRRRDIMDLAVAVNARSQAESAILEGISFDAFRGRLLLERQGHQRPLGQPAAAIGMSDAEARGYSLMRALHALASRTWDKAGLELEASRAVAKKLGRDPNGIYVPLEVQERGGAPVHAQGQRDLSAVTASAGGFLVPTQNQGFIDQLRGRSVTMRMGATRLSGLSGNITVPRQTAPATAAWLGNETTAATESQQTFGQMALTPKNVAAYTEVSRQLMLQASPSVDQLVMNDLAAVVALAVDSAALNGTGAGGQPLGVFNTSGIGSVTGGSLAYAGVIEFQTDVAGANALVNPGSAGYVTTVAVAGLMAQRQRFTSTDTPLWTGNILDGQMLGFPAMSSTQMPTASMLFGDWSQLVIGEWGVLDVEMNPYANFPAGIYGFRAFYTVDVGLRYAASFSAATGIT